jgi:hypothetical protein
MLRRKLLKSRVDLDHPSKGTHVRISVCLGVQCSRELECAIVKSPKDQSPEAKEKKWCVMMTSPVVM